MDGAEGQSEAKVGMSAYLVNNSFRSCLQPKRQSFDIKLYMQLHKKILRRAIIHKNFEQSLTNFEHKVDPSPKGFKGRQLQENHLRHLFSTRDKRAHTEVASLRSTQTHSPFSNPNTRSNTLKNTLNNTQMMAVSRPLTREGPTASGTERMKVRTEGTCDLLQGDFKYAGAQTSHFKPNMMYNLSLYRKNFKRTDFRNERICIKVVPGQIHKQEAPSLRQPSP